MHKIVCCVGETVAGSSEGSTVELGEAWSMVVGREASHQRQPLIYGIRRKQLSYTLSLAAQSAHSVARTISTLEPTLPSLNPSKERSKLKFGGKKEQERLRKRRKEQITASVRLLVLIRQSGTEIRNIIQLSVDSIKAEISRLGRMWCLIPCTVATLVLTLVLTPQVSGEDKCIWYGVCNTNQQNLKQDCYYNGTAKQLNDQDAISTLQGICPHLVKGFKEPIPYFVPLSSVVDASQVYTCCSAEQVGVLSSNIGLAKTLMTRCATCYKNLLRQLCDFTCGTFQSQFMVPVGIKPTTGIYASADTPCEYRKDYIDELDVHLSMDYGFGTYNSCSAVSLVSSGGKVTDAMCIHQGQTGCSAERFFGYMGSTKYNSLVPFQINYKIGDDAPDGIIPYDETAIPCEQPYDVSTTFMY
uniref:Niemann-Pick C1 N-terminal domain-containing protein n=1 Tax=Timema bartmani TaxID=61472 RepID=A0A7R9F2B7_9NEOP|nr:unnamed protein product [Timema bartmani]